jgi:hypothetical protein
VTWGGPRGVAAAALLAQACRRPALDPSLPTTLTPTDRPVLQLAPLADLVPAGGLRWLVDARPRAILADATLIPALTRLVPDPELAAQARARGGIDFRASDEMVIAGYDVSTLFLAHQVVDPARVEAAFGGRVAEVQGRAIDRTGTNASDGLIREWGELGRGHETLVIFGVEAVGLARGSEAPIRAAELFAQGRLKRALPAWKAAPLDRLPELLGDAPLRAAAPGPFLGIWSSGLGGLLSAATAAGLSARVDAGTVHIRVVVTGLWGERAPDAQARLMEGYDRIVASGIGRLLGLDHPVSPPIFARGNDNVTVEVQLQPNVLLDGISAVTSAQLREIMDPSARPPRELGAGISHQR